MKQLRANALLLLAAVIWGAAFVAQSVGMDHVGPFTFLASRSFLGALALLPVIFFREKKAPKKENKMLLWKGGVACGTLLFLASLLQQIGLQYTSAGKAGFLTAMYMIFVPIVGLLFGKKPGKRVALAVILAVVGMYLLCLWDGGISGLNRGDVLQFLCALGFTGHILVIDHFSGGVDGVKMSCIQFLTCGILALLVVPFVEAPSLSSLISGAVPILYAGILSSGVGYTLQIVAQKDTDPTVASLLMSLESVFSLVFGMLLLRERMTVAEMLGCILMFAAIIWVQIPEKAKQ